jgi:hypothetical protein
MRYTDLFEGTFIQPETTTHLALKDLPNYKEIISDPVITCNYKKLTSLEGSPEAVGYSFNCAHNYLTSLKYGPKTVENEFLCNNNNLTSLEYGPSIVGDSYSADHNELTSLRGAPRKINGTFYIVHNPLPNMIGGPDEVKTLRCGAAGVSDVHFLEGAPRITKELRIFSETVMSLSGLHKYVPSVPKITIDTKVLNVLSLFLIKDLTTVKLWKVEDSKANVIINKYLGQGRKGMMLCQAELVQNGLDQYAQL